MQGPESTLPGPSRSSKGRQKDSDSSVALGISSERIFGPSTELAHHDHVAPDTLIPARPELSSTHVSGAPPAYGDDSSSLLALPLTRLSESSRSDGSSTERIAYATTTTTHTVSTTTTFFRLQRRKKSRSPLHPLHTQVTAGEPDVVCRNHSSCLINSSHPTHEYWVE